MRLHNVLQKKLFSFLVITSFLSFGYYPIFAEDHGDLPAFSADDMLFEFWLGKTYENMGIFIGEPKTVFVNVNHEGWFNGKDEWRIKAIKRLGCAARAIYHEYELEPPYNVEIRVASLPLLDGSITYEIAAAGNIVKYLCALQDYLPILSPKKETPL